METTTAALPASEGHVAGWRLPCPGVGPDIASIEAGMLQCSSSSLCQPAVWPSLSMAAQQHSAPAAAGGDSPPHSAVGRSWVRH